MKLSVSHIVSFVNTGNRCGANSFGYTKCKPEVKRLIEDNRWLCSQCRQLRAELSAKESKDFTALMRRAWISWFIRQPVNS